MGYGVIRMGYSKRLLTREKAVLATLQETKQHLSSLVLTKLLFLLRQETGVAKRVAGFYDFVPYRFGPYSFALHNDLAALKRNGYVEPSGDNWRLGRFVDRDRNWMSELDDDVASAIRYVISQRGALKSDDLLRHVYQTYPWFASKSELTDLVPKNVPKSASAEVAVYTAGYQQKTIDAFLAGLLRQGISAIIDVRSNPVSRNYGFAGRTLSTLAEKVGIGYHHFPHLGIPSDERKDLNSAKQYEDLFEGYRKKVLPREPDAIAEVAVLMTKMPSTLLCYEADAGLCHRSHLAHAVSEANRLPIVHLQ
jgi:uncharacterized protein (DUF488 family)